MKIRSKLLIAFALLSTFCTFLVASSVYIEMRPNFLEAVEVTLIDTSRFLASELAVEARRDKRLQTETIRSAAREVVGTRFPRRNSFDRPNSLRIYVTDARGIVLFDSAGEFEGRDFSSWRDVALTLRGKYGARATRLNPDDPRTSTHFVASPIMVEGEIVGVVSVGKSVESVNGFLSNARGRLISLFALALLAALLLSALATLWISRPLLRLETYVRRVNTPTPAPYPSLSNDEIGSLGRSFESLRVELEGKRFIENYVHNLTHEIKSPLTGIIGAAELLETATGTDRTRLLANVTSEARRLEDIAQKLLELASLEAREKKPVVETFDLSLIADEVVESFEAQVSLAGVQLELRGAESVISGERFLVWRALANLVQNAVEFAPSGSTVIVSVGERSISVRDSGPGLPDYALARATEKFFSLERPRTGKKSSGLGLSFVNEVMRVHGGRFTLENAEPGAVATLTF